ncbi:MAG: phosphotransferase [Oscillospiraceae bacterium]|nr:phosphotransferase [Oscillospiraceae bacterium]
MQTITEKETLDEIRHTLKCFGLPHEEISVELIENGHINSTYKVHIIRNGIEKPYIVQAVNTYVFKNPVDMMDNIGKVTAHIKKKLIERGEQNIERKVLHFCSTNEGFYYVHGSQNRFWRAYAFVENSKTYDKVENPQLLFNAGRAFGEFQMMLSDFPMNQLRDTIPDFHNTKKRMAAFFDSVYNDFCGRVKDIQPEIQFFKDRIDVAEKLINLQEKGVIPLRVTHNDTKYNNILMDSETNEALCVIDLDTVMPGLAAYDFGDAIRFAASTAAEDETDLSKVSINLEYFEAFTKGFIGACGRFFTPAEIDTMAWGARIITMELASRFLSDYINGDKYFRIHRPGQNLDRARCQIQLVFDMEQKFDKMCAIVDKYR